MNVTRTINPIEAKEKSLSPQSAPLLIETVPLEGRQPHRLFGALHGRTGWKGSAALLEGMAGGWFEGRFSLLAGDPFAIFESKGTRARFTSLQEEREEIIYPSNPAHPAGEGLAHLQGWLNRLRSSGQEGTLSEVPFANGGAIGFFSYDLVAQWERIPTPQQENRSFPDLFLLFINHFALIDHDRGLIYLVYNLLPDLAMGRSEAAARKRGREKLAHLGASLATPLPIEERDLPSPLPVIEHDLSLEDYVGKVIRAKEYIAAGDIFQANLSHRFRVASGAPSPFALYTRLRQINPSPFSAYLDLGEIEIASASPERLVRVSAFGGERTVETRPIAGTRPRGRDPEEDRQMINALCRNEKERAEHLMLVDLERNDLGKICRYGSVRVDRLMEIEKYSHVVHLVSNIVGELRSEVTTVDVIKALFPGGTITGVPKIRCMEIIAELEKSARGLYTGAIGYIDFAGEIDLNIAIRTWVRQGEELSFQVGAGIVADSDPEREYQETLQKAAALLKAVES